MSLSEVAMATAGSASKLGSLTVVWLRVCRWNTYGLWQKCCPHQRMFWKKISGPLCLESDWTAPVEEEESRKNSHANPVGFKAAPGWCLVAGTGFWQNVTKAGKTLWNHRLLSLHHNISDQAVALDIVLSRQSSGRTSQRDGKRWTNIDACCSHTVKVDGQCVPDVKLLLWRRWPHHHHNLVTAVYIHPDAYSKEALGVYSYLCINNCTYYIV